LPVGASSSAPAAATSGTLTSASSSFVFPCAGRPDHNGDAGSHQFREPGRLLDPRRLFCGIITVLGRQRLVQHTTGVERYGVSCRCNSWLDVLPDHHGDIGEPGELERGLPVGEFGRCERAPLVRFAERRSV
jgi:hypothetical protein